jgi:hypothetical protein
MVGVILVAAQPSLGRLHRHRAFDSLAKEADLVVIAEAESASESGEHFHELWGEFGGVTTTFQVEWSSRGSWTGRSSSFFVIVL